MISRIASEVGIPPQELRNLLLLVAFAAVSGIGMYVVRGSIPYITFETDIRALQFSLAYVLLGLLPVLFSRSIGTEGKAISIFLFTSIIIGLSVEPRIDMIDVVIMLLVLLGGFTYYGVYAGASNRELIALVTLIIIEGYGFAMYYMWQAFQLTNDIRLSGLTMVYITGALLVIGKMLLAEYQKASAGARYQQ